MDSLNATLLFVYGTLGPDGPEALARDGWVPDAVRGRLYDLGDYPGLVDTDDSSAGWVAGHVRAIDPTELSGRLDEYEGVAEGLYRRVRTITQGGLDVWVYVYGKPLPPDSVGPIDRWQGPRT